MSKVIQIPEGWQVKKLCEIAENIVTGSTPSTENPEYYGDNFLFVGPADIYGQKYIFNAQKKLSSLGFKQTRKLPINTILVTCIGELGKIAISSIELASNQQINALICNKENYSEFIYYSMTLSVKRQMEKMAGLQVVPIVNKTTFSHLTLMLPKSIEEQHRLAEILSTCDRAIEASEKLIAKEKQIKKGLMNDLLTHGIDETGRIRTPQTHRYKESELGMIPEGWEVKRVKDISKTYAGGTPDREISAYYGGSIPWVKSGEVNQDIINKTEEHLTEEGLKNSSARLILKDTILIAMYGATAGQITILNIDACSNQAVLAVPVLTNEMRFVYYMLNFKMPKLLFQAQGSGQPNLSKQLVDNMLFFLPEKSEQQRIAEILTAQDKKIETEEANLAKLKKLKKGLMDDLLSGGVRVKCQ